MNLTIAFANSSFKVSLAVSLFYIPDNLCRPHLRRRCESCPAAHTMEGGSGGHVCTLQYT